MNNQLMNNFTDNNISNSVVNAISSRSSNVTDVASYNGFNDLNLRKLSMGKSLDDFLQFSIFCVFSVVSSNALNAYIYLGSNLSTVCKHLASLELTDDKHIYIITCLPDVFNSIDKSGVEVISLVSFLDQIDDWLSTLLKHKHNNQKNLFIFHGIKWSDIILLFRLHNVDIYGVKTSQRHLLHKHHIRLFDYLLSLYGSLDNIYKSLIREPNIIKYWSIPEKGSLPKIDMFSNVNSNIHGVGLINYYLNYFISYKELMKARSDLDEKERHYSGLDLSTLDKLLAEHDSHTALYIKNLKDKMNKALPNSEKERKYASYILSVQTKSQLKRDKIIETNIVREKTLDEVTKELNGFKEKVVLATSKYDICKKELNSYLNTEYVSSLVDKIKGIDQLIISMSKSNEKIDFNVRNNYTRSKGYYGSYFKVSNRQYSTVIDRSIKFPIDKTIYANIYPYILDANLVSNSSNSTKMYDIQLDMEKFLYSQGAYLLNKDIQAEVGVNPKKITTEISTIFLAEQNTLYKLLENLRTEYSYLLKPKLKDLDLSEVSKLSAKAKAEKILIEMLLVIKSNHLIIAILWGRLLRIISNNDFDNSNSNSTTLHMDIGIAIYNLFIEAYFLKNNSSNLTYKEFKYESEYSEVFKIYKDSVSLLFIGSWLMNLLVECNLIENRVEYSTKNKNKDVHFFRPNDTITKKLEDLRFNNTYLESSDTLPMLIPPKPYKQKMSSAGKIYYTSGGYLLNGIKYDKPLIIENYEMFNQSIINKDNYIHSMVNTSMSVGFKINAKVLDFILENNYKYQFIIEPDKKHPLESIINKGTENITSLELEELNKFNSDKMVQGHIMRLAIVYKDLACFYIPNRIDNRGRLYATTSYLHYQGSELAKSLLSFAKYEKIEKSDSTAINYLKLYGANLFGNGVDKLSIKDKLTWFSDNIDDIINYKNERLLNKADNKLLFLAFCIEYENYHVSLQNNLSYFYSDFPVQVDASCNGYQHLSLLLGDDSLAEKLNLKQRNLEDKPQDFYSFIGINLKELFKEKIESIDIKLSIQNNNELLEERASYDRLYNLNIHRSLIKKPIMTKPYNVTIDSMREYILQDFTLDKESRSRIFLKKQDNRGTIWYIYNKDVSIKLSEKDIWLLCVSINYLIYKKFPNLFALTEYFKNVANICNALNISIPWILPSGLEIDQKYLESKTIKVRPFNHKKDTYNLQLPDTKKINKSKQIRALMPNLIHSLDGASLALVTDIISQYTDKFYSVHDCFASTCNNIDELINTIRMVFFNIYASESYLLKFDNHIKQHILHISGWDLEKPVVLGKKKYIYPDIHKILESSNYDYEHLKKSYPVN